MQLFFSKFEILKKSGAIIFHQIWSKFSGASIFLQNVGYFLLIYTVNPYYLCTFFHQKHVFGVLLFFAKSYILDFFREHLFFRQILRFFSGATIVGGVNYNTLLLCPELIISAQENIL